MNSLSLKNLKNEIESALHTLEDAKSTLPELMSSASSVMTDLDSKSLLSQCKSIVDNQCSQKPTIRVLRGLACSGGTLVAKCIGAQPNTYLLSEVHPHTLLNNIPQHKPTYAPTDIVKLARYAEIPRVGEFEAEHFKLSMRLLQKHLSSVGGVLVLREHSHADFCVGSVFSKHSKVLELLQAEFHILTLIACRHPMDSFLSLEKNGWLHFEPPSFEEYCKRYWEFIKDHGDGHIVKYEEFVADPDAQMKTISNKLELSFDENFVDIFPIVKVTGDSGRSGINIGARPRREISDQALAQYRECEYYLKICLKLNYEI